MSLCLLALTLDQYLLIGVGGFLLLGVIAAAFWRANFTGTHGSPDIAPFPCSATSLSFTLDSGGGGDVPNQIFAVIFCSVPEPVTPDPAWEHPVNSSSHPTYSLTGVHRIGAGSICTAKVWCCYTSPPPECKSGTKSCDSGSGGDYGGERKGGGGGSGAMFRLAPQQYLLSVGQLLQSDAQWLQELAGDHPLKLAFQPDQSHAQCAVWRTQNGSAFTCELQVVKEGDGQPRADLTVIPKSNGSAARSIRWSTDYWSFSGINRLVAAQHSVESDYPQTVTVSPA